MSGFNVSYKRPETVCHQPCKLCYSTDCSYKITYFIDSMGKTFTIIGQVFIMYNVCIIVKQYTHFFILDEIACNFSRL